MRIARSKLHFIGIGGIGMSGLAELLKNMGASVTGSDLKENAQVKRLREMGIEIFIGHRRGQIGDSDVVVYSSAVPEENPEIVEALERKIPIIPRAEVLAEIMRLKRGVAVGGCHGKTTTTSMTAAIFIHAKKDPTVVVGGRLDLIKSNALLGQGDWIIAEADESDGSFLKLSPEIAIMTNIDNDHLDYYKSIDRIEEAFEEFGLRVPFYGLAIACGDDPRLRKVFRGFQKRIIFYGFGKDNDLRLEGENGLYCVFKDGKRLGEFRLEIPGRHNALNALAAIAAGLEVGLPFETCADGLALYKGVDRRFQKRGEARNILFYDDYGHHPTEVTAVISAAKERFPDRRLVVLFQPHRYSRTQLCWTQFQQCFAGADKVFMWDIYAASERPLPGITAQRLAADIAKPSCDYVGGGDAALNSVESYLKDGDLVLTMGAGDIWDVGLKLLARLR